MQIIHEELQPLDSEESATLKRIRDKKFYFWLIAYLVLIAVLIIGYVYAQTEAEYGSSRGMFKHSGSEEKAERFARVGPYMILFFFSCLSVFFIRYYLRTVHPFMKDFKLGRKRAIQFNPESYKTPYFDTFYLRTHFPKKPMLRISREMYNAIQPGVIGKVSMLPNSRFVLSLEVGNEIMKFNEKNTILDM